MSRRIVHLLSCDRCGTEAEADHGVEGDISLTLGSERKEVDLCQPCFQVVHEAIGPLLSAGRKPTADVVAKNAKSAKAVAVQVANSATPFACPECDGAGTPKSFSRPQGLGRHRLSVHGVAGAARAKS